MWSLVVLVRYFDPSMRLWLTSLGLAAIVGTALYISSTAQGNKLGRWQIIRLFLMPFFVSSFAALVKGRGLCWFFHRARGRFFSRSDCARCSVLRFGF
jgi:hypothetical protein